MVLRYGENICRRDLNLTLDACAMCYVCIIVIAVLITLKLIDMEEKLLYEFCCDMIDIGEAKFKGVSRDYFKRIIKEHLKRKES